MLIIVAFLLIPTQNWYEKDMSTRYLVKNYNPADITIGIIDTGLNQKLLEEYNVIRTYNSINESADVNDGCGHGTEITSIICGNGYLCVHGLAQKAKIVVIKAADENGRMTPESLLKGLKYAEKVKCDVVNISLGGYISSDDVANQIISMYNNNIAIIAASGDYAQKDILFPANLAPYVISVAALTEDGTLWNQSNIDDGLITAFPGVNIEAIDNNLEATFSTGTSEATAIASSYVALIKAEYIRNHNKPIRNSDLSKMLNTLYKSNDANKYKSLFQFL